jgi:hypothetical protein
MNVKLGAVFASLTFAAITAAAVVAGQQGNDGKKARMGPDRRAATVQFLPDAGGAKPTGGKVGSGLSFAQIKPTLAALLKEHGSAKVTTLGGIEVSVRLYDAQELDSAEALLKQVLLEGPVDIRGPADAAEDDPAGERESITMKQKARKLLSAARREIASGDLEKANRLLNEARTLDSKWGLFDDTPDKVGDALRKARAR